MNLEEVILVSDEKHRHSLELGALLLDLAADKIHENTDLDIRLGYRQWDSASNSWNTQWGVAPYTAVEVTVLRRQGDHVLLAPPFIIDDGHVEQIADTLAESVDAAVASVA